MFVYKSLLLLLLAAVVNVDNLVLNYNINQLTCFFLSATTVDKHVYAVDIMGVKRELHTG